MSEIARCYDPESFLPKKKKSFNLETSTTETFYIPRRTAFNLDFKFGRKRKGSALRLVKKREFAFGVRR